MALKSPKTYLTILILVSTFLGMVNLGTVSLWNNNEPRYAHTARNMLEAGDWITPMYKGRLRSDKPILTYWLIMISAKILNHGEVDEFNARLPFAILGVLGTLVIFFFGTTLGGVRAGFISALALLFTHEYITTARKCLPDMALCFFVLLTLYLFYKGYTSRERKGLYYLLAYIPAGLGFLTKGPVAVVIPGGVALLYLAARRDLKEIKKLRILPGLAIFLTIVLPWFLAVPPKFSKEFFLLHNLKHGLKGLDHQKPWYFYFEAIYIPFAPAILFLPAGAWFWKKEKEKTQSPFLLPLLWFFFPLILFSLAAAKRVIYLLPIAPALALIAGLALDRFLEGEGDRTFHLLIHMGLALGFLSLAVLPFLTILYKLPFSPLILASSIIPLTCLIFFWKRGTWANALICLGILFLAAYSLYFLHLQPQYDRLHRSAKPLAIQIRKIVDDAPLYRMGPFDAALEFYLGRPHIPKISGPEELKEVMKKTGASFFIITREKYWKKLIIGKSDQVKINVLFSMENRHKKFLLLKVSESKKPWKN
jgi:4-amino-4-deoxy-L-arabinose transferase-like glycosyltransferase